MAVLALLALPDHEGATRAVARTGRASAPGVTHRLQPAAPRRLPVDLPRAEVTVTRAGGSIGVPRSYLGLSTEYWTLPIYERHIGMFERVISLLEVRGDGPPVLRIGGDSADRAFWDPRPRRTPQWIFNLTPAWLSRASGLVRRMGLRVILDLNLVTSSPLRAAQWAGAAEADLPPRSIVGLEIGNEPDIYSRRYWRATLARAGPGAGLLPRALSAGDYIHRFHSYAQALARVAPSTPLAGPVLAHPALDVDWISSLLAGAHARLGVVSAHSYPYSACVGRSSSSYPTIARLLSERASAGVAQAVGPAVRLAHRAGLPFRLTELNSVTCGGRRGVSDTFATALWAPDTLFELLRAGVDGVNMHTRANPVNAPFALSADGLTARPLLYGLILFARTLGPRARLVHVGLHAERRLHLKVWAVRLPGNTLHVLVIDKGTRAAAVDLRLPATGAATVERLLAPSPGARSGVTLAGQRLGRDGAWRGRRRVETIAPGPHGYELTMPAASAALVSVHVPSGGRTPRPAGRTRAALRRFGGAPRRVAAHTRSPVEGGHSAGPYG